MTKILVIDDDAAYRRLCGLALTAAGFQVLSASDGAKGLRILESAPVDLVVTDILMPNTEGVETILTIQKKHPGIPVIAMSGGGSVAAEWCLTMSEQLGAAGVLRKPFTLDDLVVAVRKALPPSAGGPASAASA
jgi:DNA-binding NtrC family response regulator